jgi:hypothetical protein
MPTPKQSNKPSDNFRKAVRQILSVPRAELAKREAEYRNQQKAKKAKRETQ